MFFFVCWEGLILGTVYSVHFQTSFKGKKSHIFVLLHSTCSREINLGYVFFLQIYFIIYHLQRWNNLCKPWRLKDYFQFKIVINVLVSSFRFIWIPILWVYGHYKYLYSYSAEIDFRHHRRQILTSKVDVRAVRNLLNVKYALKDVDNKWYKWKEGYTYLMWLWPLVLYDSHLFPVVMYAWVG